MLAKGTFKIYMEYRKEYESLPLLVKFMPKQEETRYHNHEYVELAIVLGGNAIHRTEYGEFEVHKGSVLAIPRGGYHSYHDTVELSLANILIDPKRLPMPRLDLLTLPGFNALFMLEEEFFSKDNPYPSFVLAGDELERVNMFLGMMAKECRTLDKAWSFTLLGLFMVVLSTLSRSYGGNCAQSNILSFNIGKVLSHINNHYHEHVTVNELHKIAFMSKSTFLRNFVKATGVTPMDYLIQVRISHACALLSGGSDGIADVALNCGFDDCNYFSRIFKKHLGKTPLQYRKNSL